MREQNKNAGIQLQPILVNSETAATMLGISKRHFDSLERGGKIGPMPAKLGGRVLWCADTLRSWAAAGCPAREQWLKDHGGAE
jgi:predicted DNA-binding transcriptional regulator AlpA